MRQERTVQASIFDLFAGHEIGRELKAMSSWLDDHRELLGLVAADLRRHGVQETGRQGLPAEAVLRCAVLKQHRQLSYQELAFHLEDSASFRAFARLPWSWSPRKSVLHKTISAIRAETWEQINRALLASAREAKLERGHMVRLDSTVTAALMHEPSDSSLLWDAVRMMARLLKEAKALGAGIALEPHADIIRKGREIAYGHKLNLTTGRSGLILDLVVEAGNPADSERLLPMLERHSVLYGELPRQAAADGSYASRDNLRRAKACGVRDMAFHKKGGLGIEDMVRSRWVYRKLRNFRAGIEADISCLKRAYGLARCTWRGLGHFRAYVWSAVVAYNLALLARLEPA
jgi:transposase, IS5 family